MTETIDRFLAAGSLAELGADYATPEAALQAWAEACWARVSGEREKYAAAKPEQLDCCTVEAEGVTYRVYGVLHGWTGGPSEEYRQFVVDGLADEKTVLFEKMLGAFYGGPEDLQVPDFTVLGRLGQFSLGLRTMLTFPHFMALAGWDLAHEVLRKTEGPVTSDEQLAYSIYYHNIDAELRRGLAWALPTRLQIEYERGRWSSWKRYIDLDRLVAVAPRSAYIADFAREYARAKGVSEVAVVVGDRHLTETVHFLREPEAWPAWHEPARRHAALIARRRLGYHYLFARYMLVLSLGVTVGIIPYLAAFLLLGAWWRR